MSLTVGTRFGAYEVLGPLGEGGMGEVYRAHDTELERDVAIKVLPVSFVSDDDRVARFEQEAKTLASLNHPNIAQVYGLARGTGQTAIVMELVEGSTLADRIEQGPLPADEALGIAMQIADALEAAHEQRIIHRDLKPANVKCRPDGTVKVLDFGIAKALDTRVTTGAGTPALTTPAMTAAGIVLGTAAYMSPEQARGKPVDERADIWAFGVLLYEMLTGQPAFAGEDVTITLARVLERDTNLDALPRVIAPSVRHTIKLCLQKDVRRRLRHIGDVRLGLQGALETEGQAEAISATPIPASRRFGAMALTAVVAMLITSAVTWSLWPQQVPERVSRFNQQLPQGLIFRRSGRRHIALAPNGAATVYNTGAGLILREVDDVEMRIIAGTEPDLVNPFFSADSREVAYWGASGDLYRVAIDGGSPPVLIASGVTNPYGASWSEDNTILLGQEPGIFVVSADGGTPELLIAAEGDEILYGAVRLPDGDSVLFGISGADDSVDGRIVVESLATGDRTVLIEGGNEASYVPTGHLVYARGDVLLGVPFDLETLTVTGSASVLVPNVMRANAGQTGVAQYGIADDGTLVYVSGEATTAESSLVWVARDGSAEPLSIPSGAYNYPRISPDRTRLILDGGVGDDGFEIWNFASEILTRLTLDGRGTGFPIWTSDSNRIVYSAIGGGFSIESKAANDTGQVEVLASGWVNDMAAPSFFTPDNSGLVFSVTEEGSTGEDFGLVTIGGDEEAEWIVREAGDEMNAELSPNGRWMAYQSNVSGREEIYVRPFPDVESDRIPVSNTGGFMPLWSPDGRELFYLLGSNVGTEDRMMAVSVTETDGAISFSDRRVVIDPWVYVGTFSTTWRPYDISEDGQRFLAIRNDAISDLSSESTFVLNWFEELKRLVPTD